jgi:acetyltransferase-like isoleucine patch superfamily enzyme
VLKEGDVVCFPGGEIGARSITGERIVLTRPGPELDYWEGED